MVLWEPPSAENNNQPSTHCQPDNNYRPKFDYLDNTVNFCSHSNRKRDDIMGWICNFLQLAESETAENNNYASLPRPSDNNYRPTSDDSDNKENFSPRSNRKRDDMSRSISITNER